MNWPFSLERGKQLETSVKVQCTAQFLQFCKKYKCGKKCQKLHQCPLTSSEVSFHGRGSRGHCQVCLSATAGGHMQCSLACASEGTGGQEERVVQNYSSKAAVEEIDFQHFGLAV